MAAQNAQDPAMRDLEQELASTMARAYDRDGQPREGFFNLTRRMENEEEDQFHVDYTILDFLVYKATAVVFEWQASTNKFESDLPNALVTMTADWRFFLSQKHKGQRLSNATALRSRLLQFVLLLTHRYHSSQTWTNTESQQVLREQNKQRSDSWHAHNGHHAAAVCQPFTWTAMDSAQSLSVRQLRAIELRLPLHDCTWITDPTSRASLYTLLPLFVELTALRTTLSDEWAPSPDWFDLAGQYMLQCVIEEYLLHGASGEEVFNAAFAFGGFQVEDVEDGSENGVQNLFCEDGGKKERKEWADVRRKYISELLSSSGECTFEKAQRRHPYPQFEERLLSFLKYLHNDLVKPDLVQVEEGQINIDGNELSEAESKEMIERMRL